jgi:signal transduction histidine kinase
LKDNTDNLERLRRRLTAWYAVTLGTIVVLLGAGLFIAIRQQIASQLDASLVMATDAISRATSIREAEETAASGAVMDAVGELRIPDRVLYLFDSTARAIVPAAAPAPITEAAMQALRDSAALTTLFPANDHVLRVYARRFRSRSQRTYVAVAVADQVELEDQYAALIVAFGAAALVALVLFAAGGYFLTRKSVEPVERAMSYMRRFMADAAHELRTPLAVVRSRAEVALAADEDAGRQREALVAIEREAIRLGRIVEDLLLLARSDAGGWPVEVKRIFLDDVTSDAVSAASSLASRKGVNLELDRFEEAAIDGDATLVRQLLMIILDNAIKFTPAGGSVLVSVSNSPQGPLLTVSDSGIGIPAAQMEHVFERFYRGDVARGRGEGAGLGLSIAQWIAEVHNARISLRSDDGRGTVVEARFPPPARQ